MWIIVLTISRSNKGMVGVVTLDWGRSRVLQRKLNEKGKRKNRERRKREELENSREGMIIP